MLVPTHILRQSAWAVLAVMALCPGALSLAGEFETFVRPVLMKKCFRCHGANEQKGDIRLDTLPGDLSSDPRAAET